MTLFNIEPTKDFLAETKHCDFSHPDIKALLNNIIEPSMTANQRAVACYNWVRDNIPYTFGNWSKNASTILLEKEGMCTNKAVLLVTLLRACNFPAGFGIAKVKGQEYFGPLGTKTLSSQVNKVSVHFFVYIYIDNNWVKLDPSVDKELSDKTSYFNYSSTLELWDGVTEPIHYLDPSHVLEETGPIADVEDKLNKKPRNAKGIFLQIIKLYLSFLRQNAEHIKSTEHIEALFTSWLRKKYFTKYIVFSLFLLFSKFKKS